MACPVFTQDPLDNRIINVDYSDWLGSAEIADVVWTVATGLTAADDSFTTTVATNYFSGGSAGEEYVVACTITTNEAVARDKTQRLIIRVEASCS